MAWCSCGDCCKRAHSPVHPPPIAGPRRCVVALDAATGTHTPMRPLAATTTRCGPHTSMRPLAATTTRCGPHTSMRPLAATTTRCGPHTSMRPTRSDHHTLRTSHLHATHSLRPRHAAGLRHDGVARGVHRVPHSRRRAAGRRAAEGAGHGALAWWLELISYNRSHGLVDLSCRWLGGELANDRCSAGP